MNPVHAQIAKMLPSPFYKMAVQSWIDKTFPRHLFIETTATCNLTCSYCPREKIKGDMDFNLFKEIIDEATNYGSRSFSLHLFGEPLLYPKIIDAIRYIKHKNKNHTVLLTTNGTKLNELVDSVIESGTDQVYWSWRKESKFSERTIRRLKEWGKFRVRIIEELTPKDEIEKWKKWKNIEFRKLHNYGGNINTSKYLKADTSSAKTTSQMKTQARYACYHLWLAPAVAWNGKILICCSDPHQKEELGNFPHTTVGSAWRSSKLTQIRQSHLAGNYKGICDNCDVWKSYPDIFYSWQYTT